MSLDLLRRSGWRIVVAVAAAGLVVSVAASHWMAEHEDAEAQAAFDRSADLFVSRTQARLRAAAQFLHSLAALGRLVGRPDQATLAGYANELDIRFQYPGIVAVGYVEQAPAGDARRPVSYVQLSGPLGTLEPGYDAAAQPEFRALLDAARDSGDVAGASRTDAWFGAAPGAILVHPVYARGARPSPATPSSSSTPPS